MAFAEEPLDVAFEPEHAAVVGADALEDAVAVQEAVIEHADARLFGVAKLPVHPDQTVHTNLPSAARPAERYNGLQS